MSDDHNSVLTEDEFTGRPELVKKRARAIFWQRMVVALVVIYMIASMTLVVVASIEGIRARKILIDCTTPSGQCYQDGNKRTAGFLVTLKSDTKEVVVLAAACAKEPGNDTTSEIEKCVNKQLEKRNGRPPNR